jgi:nitrogen fixation protein NifQ
MYAMEAHCDIEQTQYRIYALLQSHSAGLANSEILARLLHTWYEGGGALPQALGLAENQFAELLARHFPAAPLPPFPDAPAFKLEARAQEQEELRALLLEYRADADIEREWIADILVAASMGCDHLWQDLGVWTRADLSALIRENFPRLFALNDKNMKWKKFFYKQLCAREGVYVCRAPSCDVCVDYQACFGPE